MLPVNSHAAVPCALCSVHYGNVGRFLHVSGAGGSHRAAGLSSLGQQVLLRNDFL